jgi:hypothetical protein
MMILLSADDARMLARDAGKSQRAGAQMHSFKNRTGDRIGEPIGSGFYRSDHWFTGLLSGF